MDGSEVRKRRTTAEDGLEAWSTHHGGTDLPVGSTLGSQTSGVRFRPVREKRGILKLPDTGHTNCRMNRERVPPAHSAESCPRFHSHGCSNMIQVRQALFRLLGTEQAGQATAHTRSPKRSELLNREFGSRMPCLGYPPLGSARRVVALILDGEQSTRACTERSPRSASESEHHISSSTTGAPGIDASVQNNGVARRLMATRTGSR